MRYKLFFKNIYQSTFGRIPGSYGQDDILREYIRYPKYFPLNVQIQHGWYSTKIPDIARMEKIKLMLVWSKRLADEWKSQSKRNVIIIGSPFILYKELHFIVKNINAFGTVVFPNHSTPNNIEKYNADEYCQLLQKLPIEFKPITVCLHHRDLKQYSSIFSKYGFRVVTAGDSRQKNNGFVKNFYQILSNHKYSCSNDIGSYTFYSIDLGIPFFLYGPESNTVDRHNSNNIIHKTEFHIKTRELFNNISKDITKEQENFVSAELGIHDRISRNKLRKIILLRLIFIEIPSYPIRFMKAIFRLFLTRQ